MVMTILEAHVDIDKWATLEKSFRDIVAHTAPAAVPGPVQSFLIHSTGDPALWRILSLWSSRQALDEMRGSGQTPAGVLMFRSAGAEPALSIFDVAAGFGGDLPWQTK